MQKKLKMAGAVIFLIALLIVTAFSIRWAMSLRDPLRLADFKEWVASLGVGGWIVLFAIQYAQIIIAFIPGGPVQIVAGALLGPWGGLALCLGGSVAASATVFYLVSRFGHSIIALFVEEKDINEYKFLSSEQKLERLVLLLFFLPGSPKDALTYLFALTKIRMSRFMLLSTVARIPAVATSLVAGQSIIDGDWGKALTMFIIMTAVSTAGFFIQKGVRKKINRRG